MPPHWPGAILDPVPPPLPGAHPHGTSSPHDVRPARPGHRRAGRAAGRLRVDGPALPDARAAGAGAMAGRDRAGHGPGHGAGAAATLARLLHRSPAAAADRHRPGQQPRPAHRRPAQRPGARGLPDPARRPAPEPGPGRTGCAGTGARRPQRRRRVGRGCRVPRRSGPEQLGAGPVGAGAQPQAVGTGAVAGHRSGLPVGRTGPGGAGSRRLHRPARTG